MKKVFDTIKSLAKVCLLSRPTPRPKKAVKPAESLIILANGPSLAKTLEDFGPQLAKMPTLALNFMANSPEFFNIKPDYYVLADPLFFKGAGLENVNKLWENLQKIDWPVQLCVPRQFRNAAQKLIGDNDNVTIVPYNFIGAEGYGPAVRWLFRHRLAMPRPRNVLIPSIMLGIWAGYKSIILTGADHSWLKTLAVDDENFVVSVQPHFYADSKAERQRAQRQFNNIKLHQVLDSFRIAFLSYHVLRNFADSQQISVINATPGSFIDAFEREDLKKLVTMR